MTESRFTWAVRSDVGRVREINQDSVHASDGLYVVADGMGGHRGGEVASAVAIEAFVDDEDAPQTLTGIVERVRSAHDMVLERATADPTLSGMGTTLCAVVELEADDGPTMLGLVNVGDSRIYMFADDELVQLSEDHSLVGDLVRHGRLTPEAAATHPQRNIVTRALGIGDDLEVDYWEQPARIGDLYLLCSDGLVDEVSDPDIEAVLRRLDEPSEAVDELVALAHASGSRDNVSVVVLRVDQGVPADESISTSISVSSPPTPARGTFLPDLSTALDSSTRGSADAASSKRRFRPRMTRRLLSSVVLAILILAGGLWLVGSYARNNYFVGFNEQQLVVYQGRPGGVLWFNPTIETQTPFLQRDLTPALVSEVEGNPEFDSPTAAKAYVDELESRAAEASGEG